MPFKDPSKRKEHHRRWYLENREWISGYRKQYQKEYKQGILRGGNVKHGRYTQTSLQKQKLQKALEHKNTMSSLPFEHQMDYLSRLHASTRKSVLELFPEDAKQEFLSNLKQFRKDRAKKNNQWEVGVYKRIFIQQRLWLWGERFFQTYFSSYRPF